MKFMKIEDLVPGDKIRIDENFLLDQYFHLRTIKNRDVCIHKVEKSILFISSFNITLYEQNKYLGIITIFEDEINGDYPIKIIELGKE